MIILKYGSYYYLGITTSTDRETTAIEKIVCYTHRFQEKGAYLALGVHREAPGLVRKQSKKIYIYVCVCVFRQELLLWFLLEGTGKAVPGGTGFGLAGCSSVAQ